MKTQKQQFQSQRELTCLKCGHKWHTLMKHDPLACAKCHRYDWKKPRVRFLERNKTEEAK